VVLAVLKSSHQLGRCGHCRFASGEVLAARAYFGLRHVI
jgi:hypothetical protein